MAEIKGSVGEVGNEKRGNKKIKGREKGSGKGHKKKGEKERVRKFYVLILTESVLSD